MNRRLPWVFAVALLCGSILLGISMVNEHERRMESARRKAAIRQEQMDLHALSE